MKKSAYLLCFWLITACFNQGIGQVISTDAAQLVAENFYYEKVNSISNVKKSEIGINQTFLKNSDSGLPLYYIFNMVPNGFVIVSAQKNVIPVLAYSFNGNYSSDDKNLNFEYYMNIFSKQITEAYDKNLDAGIKVNNLWNKYSADKFNITEKGNEKAIAPLLVSNWNQDVYYNEMCPADAAGPGGRTYAGCVATAMGQLMYYHRWPETGIGSYSYNHVDYGTISADFSTSIYDWNLMLKKITSSNPAVAKLLFHLGVSVDMDYGPNGSGMWNHKAAYSLRTYFKYCPETRYIWRDSTTLNWDSIVIANLDMKKPLYYAGWADDTYTSGHAFVCDGYQSAEYYHFNWGWGGADDGYFYNTQLNPSGSNFNILQELIADIYPDTINYNYPTYCSSYEEINAAAGTFTDGSGIKPYQALGNCSWLINPDCGKRTKLSFDKFALAPGDSITIYDGTNDQSSILAQYHSTLQPVTTNNTSPTILSSSDKNIFIKFTSDNIQEADGFNASYYVNFCSTDTFHASTGTVTDGSGTCNYEKITSCKWYISPAFAQSITLNFTEFDLATDNTGDYVRIYKNTISSANTIATFDHTNPPTGPLTIQAPVVIIRFITNSATQSGGWSLDYSSSTTGISETSLSSAGGIIVFPNPFKENAVIRFNTQNSKNATISITDLSGKIIIKKSVSTFHEVTEILIRELVDDIMPGCYLLKIETDLKTMASKIIRLPETISE